MKARHSHRSASAVWAALFSFATLLFTGCAGIPTALPPEDLAKVERTQARSYVPQSEVQFQFMPSSYGAGLGLIGAIVDVSVNSALAGGAEARAKKLREDIRDFDFRTNFWTAITNVLAETPWLKLQQIDLIGSNVVQLKKQDVTNRAVMNMGSSYAISPDTRVLQVTTGLDVYVPGKHKKPAASVIMTYHSAEIGKEEGDKALALWMADKGAFYRQVAAEGIEANARMLRHALDLMGGSTNTTHRPGKIRARLVHGRGGFGIPTPKMTLNGALLDESADRVIFKVERGGFFSFPRNEVEIELAGSKAAKPSVKPGTRNR